MKSILESIRENINEGGCGGEGHWEGGCGGCRWISYEEECRRKRAKEAKQRAELKAKLDKIDKNIIDEYIKLQTAYKRKTNTYWNSSKRSFELTDEMTNIKNKAMGISNVVSNFGQLFKNKTSLTRTFTITNDVLKLVAYIISEEMDESGKVDDKLSDALKKIKNML